MDTAVFVCSCAGTCDIDLEAAREGIDDVEVAASSRLLCQDKIGAFEQVLEEYALDELVVTCPQSEMQEKLTAVAESQGIRREEIEFVDQRERAGRVHEEVAVPRLGRVEFVKIANYFMGYTHGRAPVPPAI